MFMKFVRKIADMMNFLTSSLPLSYQISGISQLNQFSMLKIDEFARKIFGSVI